MAEVIKAFRDKVTTNAYYVGDDYKGDRIEELTANGYLAGNTPKLDTVEEGDLDKLKVDEIKAKLDELGVEYDSKLKKPELLELLKQSAS
ncbi:phage protein [Streptococcus pyogenes]|uniref:HeH/LEM domain-containing protein n=1 Tax=Streptococcus pyogenes TaxID=1314 RepID=UPI0010A0FA54|nr:HeH/LEM domain-containing protein [Streptococcus pyogenes]VGV62947.1 phage protein [Streptococcus pyogenes]VHA81669.1 phage protein [Streptococcus pyogenes]VHD23437.1 phage protein [Streptococcus pyogenes]